MNKDLENAHSAIKALEVSDRMEVRVREGEVDGVCDFFAIGRG